MSELYTLENHKRKPAERAEREGIKLVTRTKPPRPSAVLDDDEIASFEELADQLEAKANQYSQLAEQARAAEWDELHNGGDSSRSDEVNFGVLETFARNVADRIKGILEQ